VDNLKAGLAMEKPKVKKLEYELEEAKHSMALEMAEATERYEDGYVASN
jgi:hypothetical protein